MYSEDIFEFRSFRLISFNTQNSEFTKAVFALVSMGQYFIYPNYLTYYHFVIISLWLIFKDAFFNVDLL